MGNTKDPALGRVALRIFAGAHAVERQRPNVADKADLSASTVADFEAGRAVADCLVDALEVTLEAAGVEFDEHDESVCVRLKKTGDRFNDFLVCLDRLGDHPLRLEI